jgi:hypothetical protein
MVSPAPGPERNQELIQAEVDNEGPLQVRTGRMLDGLKRTAQTPSPIQIERWWALATGTRHRSPCCPR